MSSNQETTMLWKVEPLSPSGTPPLDIDGEEWLSFDEKPVGFGDFIGESSELDYEEQLTRAQVATKYLAELELKNDWIKEESFEDWLEEKIELPIFEELPVPECGQNRAVIYANVGQNNSKLQQLQQHHQHHHVVGGQPVDATQTLLREFETVLGDVEACHQISAAQVVSTLTPPQSPPPLAKQLVQQNAHLLVSLQPLHHSQASAFVYEQQHLQHHEESLGPATTAAVVQQQGYGISSLAMPGEAGIEQQLAASQWSAENLSLVPLVHGNDVAHELAKVDEYVLSCAADVVGDGGSPSGSPISPPSPCTSSNASCISSEDSSDPDWCFEPQPSSSGPSGGRRGGSGRRASNKPYSRPTVEDKRVRKKEQNKNAATRYRQKKKAEIKEILTEEQELVNKNEKLQDQLKDLQREIGYLKGLMRDLFKAKGLIK